MVVPPLPSGHFLLATHTRAPAIDRSLKDSAFFAFAHTPRITADVVVNDQPSIGRVEVSFKAVRAWIHVIREPDWQSHFARVPDE